MTRVSHTAPNKDRCMIFDIAPIDCSMSTFNSSHDDDESGARVSALSVFVAVLGDGRGMSAFRRTCGESMLSNDTHSPHISG